MAVQGPTAGSGRTLRFGNDVDADLDGLLARPQHDAADRRHVGIVAADGQDDVVLGDDQSVGRVEPDPAVRLAVEALRQTTAPVKAEPKPGTKAPASAKKPSKAAPKKPRAAAKPAAKKPARPAAEAAAAKGGKKPAVQSASKVAKKSPAKARKAK